MQAVGDIVYFGGIVRVVTAVTARTPDAYHYQAIVEARTWQAKTATNNGTRQWTYTLEAEDTELYIEINIRRRVRHSGQRVPQQRCSTGDHRKHLAQVG